MTGKITPAREPVLAIVVHGFGGQSLQVSAVVDTGFNGYLTLPGNLVKQLELPFHSYAVGILADGSSRTVSRFRASVTWHGRERRVMVLRSDGGILLGMSLLYGSRVSFDAQDGGALTIESFTSL